MLTIFLQKLSIFWQKTVPLLNSTFTINENVSFADRASAIRRPDCSKLTIIQRNDNDVTIF